MANGIQVTGSTVSWSNLFDRPQDAEAPKVVDAPEEAPPEAALPGSSRALQDLFASLPASAPSDDDATKAAAGAAAVAGRNDWLGHLDLPTIALEDSKDTSE